MLNRTVVLLAILIAASSWQEASAKIIQVDFTAELIGADPELADIDSTIEGSYRFDDEPMAIDENYFGELLITELYDFQVELAEKNYTLGEGLVYYYHNQRLGFSLPIYHGIKVGDADPLLGLTISDSVPSEMLLGIQDYLSFDASQIGTQQGLLRYVGNTGGIIESEEIFEFVDDISDEQESFIVVLGDLDGNGEIDADEVLATFSIDGDVTDANYYFQGIPDVLYPSVEIDFNSVFSVLSDEEFLVPAPTTNGNEKIIKLSFYETVETNGELELQTTTAEYQITTLVTTVLVPEPTSFATLILVLALLPRRRSGL